MNKFINVQRKEIQVMQLEHEGYEFTYVRYNFSSWLVQEDTPCLKRVTSAKRIAELEVMYAASVLEAVTKN